MNVELVRCREEDLTKMNIQFVRCSEEDLPKILEIYTEAFPKEERKPFQVICEHNRTGKAELQSVLIDGDVAGMVHTYLFDGFAMVDYFAIHKDKRNLGIGTHVIDLIREKYKGYKIYLEIEDASIGEPSLMAESSIEEIQSRSKGFRHPALWYTRRKISSPSRPASVAHTRLATSSLAMSFFRIPNCFFVPLDTSYCQSTGRRGRSAYAHLLYLGS